MKIQIGTKEACMEIETGRRDCAVGVRKQGKLLAILAAAALAWLPIHALADDGGDKHEMLTCNDSIRTGFHPDALTTVLLVHAFKKGDPLALAGGPSATSVAANENGGL